jgi:hypothetical protein
VQTYRWSALYVLIACRLCLVLHWCVRSKRYSYVIFVQWKPVVATLWVGLPELSTESRDFLTSLGILCKRRSVSARRRRWHPKAYHGLNRNPVSALQVSRRSASGFQRRVLWRMLGRVRFGLVGFWLGWVRLGNLGYIMIDTVDWHDSTRTHSTCPNRVTVFTAVCLKMAECRVCSNVETLKQTTAAYYPLISGSFSSFQSTRRNPAVHAAALFNGRRREGILNSNTVP